MGHYGDSTRLPRPPGLVPDDIVAASRGQTGAMLIDCWARAFRLRRRTLVGRDAGVVDIAILDDVVSQRHAELILGPYGWHIVDWHSTNGTFVDGKRITGVHMLSDGQVITFGDVGFVFVEDARRSGR